MFNWRHKLEMEYILLAGMSRIRETLEHATFHLFNDDANQHC